jgi:hypothetical protein
MANVWGNEKMNSAHIIPKVRATVVDQSLSKIMYQRRQSFGFCAADTIWLERSVLTQKKDDENVMLCKWLKLAP